MRFVVAFAFKSYDDAMVFKPTYDMSVVAAVKLVATSTDEIDYEGLNELFDKRYVCYITMNVDDNKCDFVYFESIYEAAS